MLYRPYQQTNIDWIMVPDIDQVEKIAVQPFQRAWIMVQNEPVFALRTSDAMGLTTTEYYSFQKYEKPRTEFITADQLEKVLEKLKGDLNESIIKSNKPSESESQSTEPINE